MAALVTHQMQAKAAFSIYFATIWKKWSSFNEALKKRTKFVGPPFFPGQAKELKITCFKGTGQSEDSSGSFGSKYQKNSVKLSYVQQGSEETLTELSQDVPVPSSSAKTTEGSQAIQSLFRNWLTLLRTPSPNQVVDEAIEKPASEEKKESEDKMQNNGRSEILKAVWYSFWGLDAMIKMPLLIFVPLFLGINVVHGAAVSKELTPLWVIGPIIVAVYVNMFRAICALYVFAFKKTLKIINDVPTYYAVARRFTSRGKPKEALSEMLGTQNLNFKDITEKLKKDFSNWLVEKYLDFIESIWPTYCRTIRFMKKANLL
ncbi:hypothetical protein DCAR_0414647 [Daucus carota subsp. sativus]|uniref:Uncharacterized protein n=1 Tax=Daucus carota subsp. sativus TaxID=79200 RepID=A0AAF0WSJ1_DAUCS|nr:hypothetical protein DCAR_0414647 [Daucus carota subsp. sativus]